MGYSRFVLTVRIIDRDLHCNLGNLYPEFKEIRAVPAITRHRFGLESLHLHQAGTPWYSRLVLRMQVIYFDLQGHFGLFWLRVPRKIGLSPWYILMDRARIIVGHCNIRPPMLMLLMHSFSSENIHFYNGLIRIARRGLVNMIMKLMKSIIYKQFIWYHQHDFV